MHCSCASVQNVCPTAGERRLSKRPSMAATPLLGTWRWCRRARLSDPRRFAPYDRSHSNARRSFDTSQARKPPAHRSKASSSKSRAASPPTARSQIDIISSTDFGASSPSMACATRIVAARSTADLASFARWGACAGLAGKALRYGIELHNAPQPHHENHATGPFGRGATPCALT